MSGISALADAVERGKLEPYVAALPAVRALARGAGLAFTSRVTILTGDNGSGKSTLLEAIALKLGFDGVGGPRGGFDGTTQRAGTGTESALSFLLRARLRRPDVVGGFYLRSETHLDLAFYAESAVGRAGRTELTHDVRRRSHGEAVLDLLGEYIRGEGIYLLDEPEAGLSVVRQLALLAEIAQAAELGAQFLICTHSPVLPALPGATVLEITEAGLVPVAFDEVESVAAMREFLDAPEDVVRFVIDG
ncbi:AAA family ATPase [Corynebacterium uterequi]|uniref:AAA family ATPase n=1 Tax=Corynebacterium uterequi TaxID=1072256 RepID=UPI00069B593A|nr:AAA family ATPase [Corynebacterium uterequi]